MHGPLTRTRPSRVACSVPRLCLVVGLAPSERESRASVARTLRSGRWRGKPADKHRNVRIANHDGGRHMLVQDDPIAIPGCDDPEGATAKDRLSLHVEAWHDAVIDRVGYDPRSAYAETFWLPVLGPSTTWLLRHFTIQLERSPEGVELDVEDTARSLGLGERLNPNGPFARTLKRCVDFEMARWRGPQLLVVRTRLPPLARRHVRRLPASLQTRYESAQIGSVPSEPLQELPRDGARARSHL
jgi:hypothetical protein